MKSIPSFHFDWKQILFLGLAGILVVCLVAYYFPVLVGSRCFFLSDHCFYFQPLADFIGERFKLFKLPLWNPYMHAGMPQLAVPSPGVFYPPNLLFAVLDYSVSIACLSLFHHLVALMGGCLLVSPWGVAPAMACGMTFALSGYMFTLNTNHTLSGTAAWIPLTWWLLRQQNNERWKLASCVLCALSVFLMIAAGRPEIYMPALALLFVSSIAEATIASRADAGVFNDQSIRVFARRLAWPMIALGLGVMTAAPCILPVAEWTALSPRADGLNFNQALSWSSNWYDLVCLIYNRPLGDLQILGAPHLKSVATRVGYLQYMPSAYFGAVAFTLALLGFADKTWRSRVLILVGLAIMLTLALGQYTPVAPWLMTAFPKLIVLRYPVKLLVFVDLLVAVACARGIALCLKQDIGKTATAVIAGLWIIGVLCGVFFWAINPPFQLVNVALNPAGERLLGKSLLFGSLIGLVTVVVARRLRGEPDRLISALLAALLGSLMAGAFTQAQKTCERGFYNEPSVVAQEVEKVIGDRSVKGRSRMLPLYFDPLAVPDGYKGRANSAPSEPFFHFCRQLLLPNTHVAFRVPQAFGYESAETNDYRKVMLAGIKSIGRYDLSDDRNSVEVVKLCMITSSAVVARQRIRAGEKVPLLNTKYFELLKDIQQLNVRIYKVRKALPRAYVSDSWVWIDDQKEAIKLLAEPTWKYNPSYVTVVERGDYIAAAPTDLRPAGGTYFAPIPDPPDKSPLVLASLCEQSGTLSRRADFLQDDNEHVAVSVKLDKPAFVVLNDHFYPGWQAAVDGVPVRIYRANAVMRAVFVPEGAHLITFDYKPQSLHWSLMISCFAIIALLIMVVILLRRPVWRFVLLLSGK